MENRLLQSTSTVQHLTSNDLSSILNILNSVAWKCKDLGIQLGLKSSWQNIACNYPKCEDQLREIIVERLKQNPPLTWLGIVDALKHLMEDELASEIEQKYLHCTNSSDCCSISTGTMPPTKMARIGGELSRPFSDSETHYSGSPLQVMQLSSHSKSPQHSQYLSSLPPTHSMYQPQQTPTYCQPQVLPSHPNYSCVLGTDSAMLVNRFYAYVKTLYRRSAVERSTQVVKWPPTPSKIYINLACIDRNTEGLRTEYDNITRAMIVNGEVDVINGRKCPTSISQIASNLPVHHFAKYASSSTLPEDMVILIEGAPGVGKSTFAWEFCRRWERGEIASQYHLVLLIRLRDLRISSAKNLKDLIYHPSEIVCQAVITELEYNLGVNTLIFLEGFDELPDSCRTVPSIFLELIYGQLLPLATVMITSRPWATHVLHENCSHRIFQHIEILGFTKQQIANYINSSLSKWEAKGLEAYINKYPQIRTGMYIPLNSVILVTVYQESKASGCPLPKTLTELYTALTRTLLIRYLQGHYKRHYIITTYNDLPPAVKAKFLELCKLAYSSIAGSGDNVQLIFNNLPSDFDSLGFMDSVTELYVTQGTISSYNFLHLTCQEYLAAVHISNMKHEEQLQHFQRHNEGKLRMVLRFIAGLTSLKSLHHCNFVQFLHKPSDCSNISIDAAISYQVCWVHEAQRADLIHSVFHNNITVEFRGEESVDYWSLGYCISNSQCQWMISFGKNIHVQEEEAKMLLGTGQVLNTMRIVGLRGGFSMSTLGLNMLFTKWKKNFRLYELALKLPGPCDTIAWPDLSTLKVLKLHICGDSHWKLGDLLHYDLPIRSLTIASHSHVATLTFVDCRAVGHLLRHSTCLTEVCFAGDRSTCLIIDEEGLQEIMSVLNGTPSLQLKKLDFNGRCIFSYIAAEHFAQFITNTTTLDYVNLQNCVFGAHGLLVLVQALYKNLTIQWKKLEYLTCFVDGNEEANYFTQLLLEFPEMRVKLLWNKTVDDANRMFRNISHDGVKTLSKIIPLIETLYLSSNSIYDAGAEAIANALQHNTVLTKLYLSNNNIGDTGAVSLAQALNCNSTLTELNLSNNIIGYPGAVALFKVLQPKSTLTMLDLSNNNIICTKGVTLFQTIHLSTLEVLNLSDNKVGDAGAVNLANSFSFKCKLVGVNLSSSGIGDAGATALARSLHRNYAMRKLDLHNNRISDAGTEALAKSLPLNTLEELNLSSNSIGDAGAEALVKFIFLGNLRELSLANNNIGDNSAVLLGKALQFGFNIQRLALYGNYTIGEKGTCELVEALTNNANCTLQLSQCCSGYTKRCASYETVKDRIEYV